MEERRRIVESQILLREEDSNLYLSGKPGTWMFAFLKP